MKTGNDSFRNSFDIKEYRTIITENNVPLCLSNNM